MFRKYFALHVLYDTPNDGSGGGGAAAGAGSGSDGQSSGAGAAGAPAAGAAAGSGGAPAGGAGAAGAGAGGARRYEYTEDRSNWHPPQVNSRLAAKYRELETQFQQMNERVRVLMGVANPPDPRNAKVLEGLAGMHPAFARLINNPNADKILDKLFQMVESGQTEELTGTADRVWKAHAFRMTTQAQEQYAKAINVPLDKLPERSINRLAREMRAFVDDDRSGRRLERYENGDPSLISEFIQDLTGFYVEPVRRQFPTRAAQAASRVRGLPSAGRSSSAPPSGSGAGGSGKPLTKRERFAKMREGFLDAVGG